MRARPLTRFLAALETTLSHKGRGLHRALVVNNKQITA
jgi:hypothetical protein